MNYCQSLCLTIQRMCNSGGSLLPAEYQQVEYLQGYAAPYINTGVEGWENLIVKIDQKIDRLQHSEFDFFGSVDLNMGENSFNYAGIFSSLSGFVLQIGHHYIQYGTKDYNRHTHTYDGINRVAYLDNNTPVSGASLYWYNTQQSVGKPFRLFMRHSNGTNAGYVSIYRATFNRGGTYIRDFVPCYRKSDNKPGMYDLVTKVFFTNAGNGEFAIGPDI